MTPSRAPQFRFAVLVGAVTVIFGGKALCADGPPATPPAEAKKKLHVAEGLQLQLIASEPLIRQPLSISFDHRGRIWLLQYIQYPIPEGLKAVAVDQYLRTKWDKRPAPPPQGPRGHDCIAILEDRDGDGVMDHSKSFLSNLNLASGMAIGYGGVFVAQPPYLLFYRDANGDDVPDGDPEVLLAGFGMEDPHAYANSLTWGPDGWLYGAQGSTVTANIRGIEFQQGIWRYHPKTKEFELFTEGGGNNWGIDFDRFGNLFVGGNTYEPLLHSVQGAYYVKGFGKHGPLHNPYSFGYFQPVQHNGPFGGGLTGGCSIYQGNAFPERFNNVCIAPNMRQNAMRWYPFDNRGTTFSTRQGGDFILSSDPWFRPVDTLVGPDGALYVADWYDINLSHSNPKDRSQWYLPSRNDGRLWRVTAKGAKKYSPPKTPLQSRSTSEVVALLKDPNEWYRREAWRILGERNDRSAVPALRRAFTEAATQPQCLEMFWGNYLSGGFDEAFALSCLDSGHEYVRAWAVRLLGDPKQVSPPVAKAFVRLARRDQSAIVRSQLACTAKRLPGPIALSIVKELIPHDEDAGDPHIPLLVWWAIEDKSINDREAVLSLVKSPEVWRHPLASEVVVPRLARRYIAAGDDSGYAACAWLLDHAPAAGDKERLIEGMETQLAGRRFDHIPKALESPIARLLSQRRPSTVLLCLAARLNAPGVLPKLLDRANSAQVPSSERVAAIQALSEGNNTHGGEEFISLLDAKQPAAVREAALAAIGRFRGEKLAARLLARWPDLPSALRDRAIDVLVSRPAWTRQLLSAIDSGRVDPKTISTEQVRRMLLHNDAQIAKRVAPRWGSVRPTTPREKQGKILAVSIMLSRGKGHADNGHQLFVKTCATCHRLFGEGNQIGPDLTAVDRKNLTVLLPNVVDPSGVIRPEYRAYNVVLADGRIVTGLLADQNEATVTVLDAKNQRTVVKRSEVEEIKVSDLSLMPDNVLEPLGEQEIRDLFAYVQLDAKPSFDKKTASRGPVRGTGRTVKKADR